MKLVFLGIHLEKYLPRDRRLHGAVGRVGTVDNAHITLSGK